MEGYYYDQAISHFKEAMKQDANAWIAKEGLARCLGEQGLYEEAIEWQEKAIDSLPPNLSSSAGYLYPHIASWKRAMGDDEGAFEAAQRAYKANWEIPLAQLRYLEALDATKSFDAIIEVLKELDSFLVQEKDYTHLVRFFVLGYKGYDEIGKACRARGKPEFVLAAMDRALSLIEQSDNEDMKTSLPAQVAAFRYDYYDQVEQPMQLWETALKRIDMGDFAIQKANAKTRKIYSNNLALLYFDAAVAARAAASDPEPYAAKLKRLSVVTETSFDDDDAFDFYGTGYASMLWGRWLRDYQHAEEAVWRKCFKARALEEIDMLDDDDPSNDTRGLHALAVTLLQAEDRINAGAILAVLFRPLEDLLIQVTEDKNFDLPGGDEIKQQDRIGKNDETQGQTQNLANTPTLSMMNDSWADAPTSDIVPKSEAPPLEVEGVAAAIPQTPHVTETRTVVSPTNIGDTAANKPTASQLKLQLGNPLVYSCDGCDRDPQDAREMYFCEVCLDKNYCSDCLPKVKTVSLWSRQCNPNHTHYRAWPIPDEARDMAVEWVEGEAALRSEWLEKLRSEWMN